MNLFWSYPILFFIVDGQGERNITCFVKDIIYVDLIFFTCLKYLRHVWRSCVIVDHLLQSPVKSVFKNADGQKLLACHSSFCWVIFKRLLDLLEVFGLLFCFTGDLLMILPDRIGFKLLFSLLFYHEKYIIKDICVYSKSKIKTKVTSKQNLEHFKMMNQRLFIHKLCNNSNMLLSSSWAIFIRVLVFLSSPRANFSSFEYLCFLFLLIFWFFLIYYTRVRKKIEKFQLRFIICFDLTNHGKFFCYSIRNYNAMTSKIQIKDNLWQKILGEILKAFFVTVDI